MVFRFKTEQGLRWVPAKHVESITIVEEGPGQVVLLIKTLSGEAFRQPVFDGDQARDVIDAWLLEVGSIGPEEVGGPESLGEEEPEPLEELGFES